MTHRRAGSSVVARDGDVVGLRLGNAGGYDAHAHLHKREMEQHNIEVNTNEPWFILSRDNYKQSRSQGIIVLKARTDGSAYVYACALEGEKKTHTQKNRRLVTVREVFISAMHEVDFIMLSQVVSHLGH